MSKALAFLRVALVLAAVVGLAGPATPPVKAADDPPTHYAWSRYYYNWLGHFAGAEGMDCDYRDWGRTPDDYAYYYDVSYPCRDEGPMWP